MPIPRLGYYQGGYPMTLEMIEMPPPPPSYAELADALLAFHAEFYALNWSDYSGTPADLVLLSLAERIMASVPSTPQNVRGVDSDAVGGSGGL